MKLLAMMFKTLIAVCLCATIGHYEVQINERIDIATENTIKHVESFKGWNDYIVKISKEHASDTTF